MLHGGGANTRWYDFIGPALSSHCHALALDLRGHGESDPVELPVYPYDAYMDDIRALLQAEPLRAACPHAEIASVADAGHHLTPDQPEQTIRLVRDFLQRHQLIS